MRPRQRFVALRSSDNQVAVMRHRVREQLVGQRTALVNALRGHLSKIGLVAAQGAQHAYRLKRMLADGADENGEIVVPERVRVALAPLAAQIDALDHGIATIDDKLIETVKGDKKARRLMTIPGVGR
jgi:transposase